MLKALNELFICFVMYLAKKLILQILNFFLITPYLDLFLSPSTIILELPPMPRDSPYLGVPLPFGRKNK